MKIVIIGGVAAGAKVAAKTRRMCADAEIYIYTEDTHVSYSACGLPFYIEGNFEDWEKLLVRSVDEFERQNIHVFLLNKVLKILPNDKKIMIKNLKTQEKFFVVYDKLVIATGAKPVIPKIRGINLNNIFTLKTLEDGIAIKDAMQKAANITLIGAGYINIELLEAFVKNNKKVILLEKSQYIMPILDNDISTLVQKHILEQSENYCKIITEDSVSEFIGEENVNGVLTQKGIGFESDMVVIGMGVRPNSELAVDAGIEVGVKGAIKVNSRMETNIKDIYACGDCVEKINIISNTPMYVPLGSTANKEARIAAMNICGEIEDFEGILSSAVTRYMNLTISKTGLSEKNAKELGYDTVSALVTKRDKAGYMPDIHNVTIKMIADKRSHRILGAQAIGCIDADKKINILSSGLANRITVEGLLELDLTYSPVYSTSIDILHNVARELKKILNENPRF